MKKSNQYKAFVILLGLCITYVFNAAISNSGLFNSELENQYLNNLTSAQNSIPAADINYVQPYDRENIFSSDKGLCVIRKPGAEFLQNVSFVPLATCQNACTSLIASTAGVSCKWKLQELNTLANKNTCRIRTSGSFSDLITPVETNEQECQILCNNLEGPNPNRICDWGSERLKNPPLGYECRILDNQGLNLSQATPNNTPSFRFPSTCQTLCDQQSAYVDRTCLSGSNYLKKPDEARYCEVYGGAGKILVKPYFGSRIDCDTSCASFTANPSRQCFYGHLSIR